jgi:hypothetical protein
LCSISSGLGISSLFSRHKLSSAHSFVITWCHPWSWGRAALGTSEVYCANRRRSASDTRSMVSDPPMSLGLGCT